MRILLIFITLLFCKCGSHSQNENLPDLSQANKVKLFYKMDFNADGKMNVSEKDVDEFKDVTSIKNVVSYDPVDYLYCISSGTMSFYHDSSHIIDMVFNTSPDFLHVAYNYNGKLIAIKLSEDNARFLESFRQISEH